MVRSSRPTWDTMQTLLRATTLFLAALVLCTPLMVTPETVYPHLVGKAVFSRAVIQVMLALWVLLLLKDPRRYRPPWSWVLGAFALYVFFALLATAFSVSPTLSFWSNYQRTLGVVDLLHGLAFAVVLLSVLRAGASWRALLSWGLLMVLIVELVAVGEAFRLSFLERITAFENRLGSTAGNSGFLAGLLVMALPISVGLLAQSYWGRGGLRGRGLNRKERRWEWSLRLLSLAVFLLGVPILLLTGTRAALLGIVAGGAAMLLGAGISGGIAGLRRAVAPVGALLCALAMVFGLYAAGLAPTPEGLEGGVVTSRITGSDSEAGILNPPNEAATGFKTRVGLWALGIKGFLHRPWLGWGPGNYSAAYDRYVDVDFVRTFGNTNNDRPHNKVVEELVDGGALGGLSYLLLWGLVGFALLRRGSEGEAWANLGVLGGLAAYFFMNLFWFDTPMGYLWWIFLVAWAAAVEARRKTGVPPRGGGPPVPSALGRRNGERIRPGGFAVAAAALGIGVGFSILFTSARPLQAALAYDDMRDPGRDILQKLDMGYRAFDLSPTSANTLRRESFVSLANAFTELPHDMRAEVALFVERETARGLAAEPRDARLLRAYITFRQTSAHTPEELEELSPLLERLVALAPGKVTTHQALVLQDVLRRQPDKALERMDAYLAGAPNAASDFDSLRRLAEADLAKAAGARPGM